MSHLASSIKPFKNIFNKSFSVTNIHFIFTSYKTEQETLIYNLTMQTIKTIATKKTIAAIITAGVVTGLCKV